MKTLFRYLVIGVLAAIVFLVGSVAIFIAVFDANAYKEDMSSLVRERTGRDLQFYGDVSLTIYPALGMKLGAMSFSNAPGFGAQPMVKVGEASISVDLASLISLAPEIDKLVLRDLEVNLIRDKSGKTNWDDLVQAAAAPPAAEGAPAAAGDGEAQTEFELKGAFGGLDLQNIKLAWIDRQADQEYRVTDLDLSTGRIVPNQPFPLTLHVEVAGDAVVAIDLESSLEYLIEQQQLTLSEMTLALNEFRIDGRLQLRDFARPTPILRFDLSSQELDVDALLGIRPASEQDSLEPAAAGAPGEDVQIALPMETLRGLDIEGRLRIAQLKAQNLRLANLDLALKADRGQVALEPLTLDAYGGKVESAVLVDVRSELPKYGIENRLAGVQAGELLRDFTGKATISGALDAETSLATSGEWLSQLKKNLNGTLKLAFLDGALEGFNIRQSIDAAKAKVRGETPPPKETLRTDFSSLTLSGVVRNGVFSSDDLALQAPLLRASGKGSADLNTETIDYQVTAKLVGTVEGQEGRAADELAGLAIPVGIKGPFTAPKIDVLLDEMLKAKADAEKARLKAEIDAQKEELKRQLEAEQKALAESKKRELEAQQEVEAAKAKEELKQKLEGKLKNLFD